MPSGDGRTSAGDDRALEALDALVGALEENTRDGQLLAERVRDARHKRLAGTSWRELLEAEDDPGTVRLVSRDLARLSAASGELRVSLVAALREEGVSIPGIARLFGVTHQRVSNILRRSAG